MSEKAVIIIGGDVLPTDSNIAFFENGDINSIVSLDLLKTLKSADYRILNLETPLVDKKTPIEKEGPCFCVSTKSIHGIKKLNPSLLTLANNHILDQGYDGLASTKKILNEHKISYVGIGQNKVEASKPLILNVNGYLLGVYACTEHEYSTATENMPGANPFDPLDTPDHIIDLKKKCEYVVVLYHGGREYYEYPSPDLQKRCRKMIDKGADYVICQHSHCIGTYEKYHGGEILYGQGNFLMDSYVKTYEAYYQNSLLVKMTFSENGISSEVVPIKRSGCGVRLAIETENEQIIDAMKRRSDEIAIPGFVQKHYQEYTKKTASRYIFRLTRFGYILSSIDNRYFNGRMLNCNIRKMLGKHQRLALQNLLQCEAHNEALRAYLANSDENWR